ncbi:sensor histidine kinase [Flavobacterium sandaracinum]|uniref:histidine kinase n=1 Tax=Flavobacterium sandaracinum TaxID=2541733 RepID=A0A4R5CXF1_9FLAO|nr:ATP-binding protein [Flavobacterium sandaracinum]TDE04200.1 tetratricopeptide repeat protein [Flavobacterium sandaracinum]
MLITKIKLVLIISSFLLFIACQEKKESTAFKNEVTTILRNLDNQKSENKDEEKTLDTLTTHLLKYKNDSVTRNLYFKIANKYYHLNKLDKYLIVTKLIYKLSVKDSDSSHIAKSLFYYGDYYEVKSQVDSAFNYYSQSQKMYKSINDTLNTGRTTLYKAGILYDTGNFTESEVETVFALKKLTKTSSTRLIYECYNLMALSIKETSNDEKAADYFQLALKQLDKLENEGEPKVKVVKSRVSIYNNLGNLYQKLKNYEEAMNLYKKGLQTKDLRTSYPKLYAMLLSNLGYTKMKLGSTKSVEKLLFESLKIQDSLQILPSIVSSKIRIGEYYIIKKDTVKGLNYIKEGFLLSKKIKSNQDIIHSLQLLTENDLKNKTFYSNLYFKVNDSIQTLERKTRNKFARIAFETEQVEENNQILSKRNSVIIIGSAIIIIFLGAFFSLYHLKSKNKELLLIKEQQEANEKIYQLILAQQSETEQARNEERNRIAMELHDGIVNSIFTTRFNLIQLESSSVDKKQELINELEKTEQEIRRVSHDLTQNLLFEDKSLTEILMSLVDSQQNQYNTKFDLSVDKYIDWSDVTGANKIHIYRIIQEAIQNSNKYSHAERCLIMLLKTADKITIRIWDNGIGFNPEKQKDGIGLKNIKDRTKSLGGELKIISNSGDGTTIEIVF